MGVTWTKEQEDVIRLRDRNILVSAAAGSGKTAVLVERILTRLTEDVPPLDVDQLLIVTYTEAAAAEMKDRIRTAIEQKLDEDPENVHLQRQATLIHSARITTIHSFCLSVIREHFHVLDLDPGFRIAEEGELKLLRHDVLSEMLETYFDEGEEAFFHFVECVATGRDDRKIEALILQMYDSSRSHVQPDRWLDSCASAYEVESVEAMEQTEFVRHICRDIRKTAEDMVRFVRQALEVCDSPDGPHMYRAALEEDLLALDGICSAKTFSGLYESVQQIKWAKLAPNRDKKVSEELAVQVKAVREEVKEFVGDLQKRYFYRTPEQMQKDMYASRGFVRVLVELTAEFAGRFEEKKRSMQVLDFTDMEQMALRILTEEKDGMLVPSAVAKGYQNVFREIMIDEYQDSNYIQEAILTSVSTVSEGTYNVFMVGDVKQSIYRFRLSRPELFMEKFSSYSVEDGEKQRIDLSRNFRSRREVLDSVNFIFRQIMTESLGGIAYDDKAALYVGADYEERPGNETEVLLVQSKTEAAPDADAQSGRELEARVVARRIKELVGNHPVYDKKTDAYRPARYGDIVVLTRSLKGWTDVFSEILNREGIPTYTGSKEGYFQTQEIGTILEYLKVLDNPRQDLPLCAVLTSYFGGFSSEELAEIRKTDRELPFYELVQEYAQNGEDAHLREKVAACLEQMRSFRGRVPHTAIHELLWQIITETGYGDYVFALPGGEQRRANLEMLIEKAVAFEATSYKGLFHFLRYMEQLQKYDVDFGEASLENEQADAVRLMSIHKSKGLEFPIVFVAGMNKGFNTDDLKGNLVIHPDLGVGVDCIDTELRTKAPTLLKCAIQRRTALENLGEELRVLYVALTRAKEKLILVGAFTNMEKKVQSFARIGSQWEKELPFTWLTGAHSYYDWVLPALVRHRSFAPVLAYYGMGVPFSNPLYQEDVPIEVRLLLPEDIVTEEVMEETEAAFVKEMLLQWETDRVFDEKARAQFAEQFAYVYPYEQEQRLKLKFTVSELKKREMLAEEAGEILYEEPEVVPYLPKFLQPEEELTGASRGSAYHRLLELLDWTGTYDADSLEREIALLTDSGKLSPEMAACIRRDDILHFLETPSAQRMRAAAAKGLLHAEQPFVLGVRAGEIYKDYEAESEDLLLVQGIIDVWFEEDDGLVVLDYKTDRVAQPQELVDRYHRQLEYYAEALERMTGKPVREKIIYSFTLRREIPV